ncbi:MAG: hypothetical protein RSG92_28675, partial [Pseudomonas sp.]
CMAMTPQERDERRREKSALRGEQDLRLKVTASHASQLADLMAWADIGESGEALTLMIYQARAIGRERFQWFMAGAQTQLESDTVRPTNRTEIRLMARRGTVSELEEIGAWISSPDQSFTIRLLIERTHARGPIQSLTMLQPPPRHKYTITNSVARRLDQFRLSRELRTPDLMLGDDPDDKGVYLLGHMQGA